MYFVMNPMQKLQGLEVFGGLPKIQQEIGCLGSANSLTQYVFIIYDFRVLALGYC